MTHTLDLLRAISAGAAVVCTDDPHRNRLVAHAPASPRDPYPWTVPGTDARLPASAVAVLDAGLCGARVEVPDAGEFVCTQPAGHAEQGVDAAARRHRSDLSFGDLVTWP